MNTVNEHWNIGANSVNELEHFSKQLYEKLKIEAGSIQLGLRLLQDLNLCGDVVCVWGDVCLYVCVYVFACECV